MPSKDHNDTTEAYLRAHLERRENVERERIARLVERKRLAEDHIEELRAVLTAQERTSAKAESALEHASTSATVRRYTAAQDLAIKHGIGHSWKLYAMWLTSVRSRREMVPTEAPAPSWPKELLFNDDERETVKRYLHLKGAAEIANVKRINALRDLEEAAVAAAEIERELSA